MVTISINYHFDFGKPRLLYSVEKITHGTQGSKRNGVYYQLAHFVQKVADPCSSVTFSLTTNTDF